MPYIQVVNRTGEIFNLCLPRAAIAWDEQINTHTDIKWNIIKKCTVYQPGNYNCDLCLTEKLCIIKSANNPNNTNKRSDIGNRCMHTRKLLLDQTYLSLDNT